MVDAKLYIIIIIIRQTERAGVEKEYYNIMLLCTTLLEAPLLYLFSSAEIDRYIPKSQITEIIRLCTCIMAMKKRNSTLPRIDVEFCRFFLI
jgi:hypothetical protein